MMIDKLGYKAPVYGNDQVVALLQAYLDWAKQGKIGFLGVVAAMPPNQLNAEFAGQILMSNMAKEAIGKTCTCDCRSESLLGKIDGAMLNVTLPPRNPALGADNACYNMAGGPCSYDFIVWLIDREMHRIRSGAPAPLKVAFWFGRDGKTGLTNREQMFHNVMRPALALIGAVEDKRAMLGPTRETYLIDTIVAASREGETVPLLKAPAQAKIDLGQWLRQMGISDVGYVTVTLRETTVWLHRNSDLPAWFKFARWLKKQGTPVIFVRDTAKVREALPNDLAAYPAAALELHARMALYERAQANLFVANGPVHLALFTDRPFLDFTRIHKDEHPDYVNTPTFWREKLKLEPGQQLPWCRPDQRIEWCMEGEDFDSYERIKAAWEAHIGGALRQAA